MKNKSAATTHIINGGFRLSLNIIFGTTLLIAEDPSSYTTTAYMLALRTTNKRLPNGSLFPE
jgi:hypothetical protein